MRLRWVYAPLLIALMPARALAQSDDALRSAHDHAAQGLVEFDNGRNEEALESFMRAYANVRVPSLAVFVARTNVRLGRFLTAAELYTEAVQLGDGPGEHDVQQKAREEAAIERAALMQQIPKLVASTPGVPMASVSFQVDEKSVPSADVAAGLPLDPGTHRITALFNGHELEQRPSLNAGEGKTLSFVFPVAPRAADQQPPPQTTPAAEPKPAGGTLRTAGWVTLGVGGLSLSAAGAGALWALSLKRDIQKAGCWNSDDPACNPAEGDRYNTVRTLSTIGFYTGTVAVATGAVLLLVAPRRHSEPKPAASLQPWASLNAVGVTGLF